MLRRTVLLIARMLASMSVGAPWDAVLAALRMVEAVDELAERGEGPVWKVRVGLHSGPVAAGVVGVRKFAFDIWVGCFRRVPPRIAQFDLSSRICGIAAA